MDHVPAVLRDVHQEAQFLVTHEGYSANAIRRIAVNPTVVVQTIVVVIVPEVVVRDVTMDSVPVAVATETVSSRVGTQNRTTLLPVLLEDWLLIPTTRSVVRAISCGITHHRLGLIDSKRERIHEIA